MTKRRHSIKHLQSVLSYDPDTGAFMWLVDASKRSPAGSIAGTRTKIGYVQIQYATRLYYAHVLAVAFSKGRWPTVLVDHKNGLKDDNRLCNLRRACKSLNGLNRTAPNKNSSTGVLGVSIRNGKYRASICVQRKVLELGLYETVEAAAAAYNEAKQRLLN